MGLLFKGEENDGSTFLSTFSWPCFKMSNRKVQVSQILSVGFALVSHVIAKPAAMSSGLWNLIQSTPFKKQTWTYAENTMLPLNVTVDMSSLVSSDKSELHFSIAGPADVGDIVNFFMANFWPDGRTR